MDKKQETKERKELKVEPSEIKQGDERAAGNSQSSFQFHRNAHEAHLQVLEGEKYCDVTFVVGKAKEPVKCHSVFLMARSPVFEGMLSNRGANKATGISAPDAEPRIFRLLLKFLYADLFPGNVTEALDLLNLGAKYKVEHLMEGYFTPLADGMTPGSAVRVFKAAESYGLEELKNAAGDVLVESLPKLVPASGSEWASVDESVWVYLLQREDLKLSEIELFTLIVRWGKSQLKDPDNVEQLRTVLRNLLHLIRFPLMTLQEFNSVAATNLLPEKTTIQLYMYLSSNGEWREAIAKAQPFLTTPRSGVQPDMETVVHFYEQINDEAKLTSYSSAMLKECMRFKVLAASSSTGKRGKLYLHWVTLRWPELFSCRPVNMPHFSPRPNLPAASSELKSPGGKRHCSDQVNPHNAVVPNSPYPVGPAVKANPTFTLSVLQVPGSLSSSIFGHNNLVTKFRLGQIQFLSNQSSRIEIRPPVEQCDGQTYYVCLEEEGFQGWAVQYKYQVGNPVGPTREIKLRRLTLELSQIRRNELFSYAVAPFSEVQVIQSMGIKCAEELPENPRSTTAVIQLD